MKLNSELLDRTLSQIDAQVISEDHPALAKLKDIFGDHTFLVDSTGLNIVEPMDEKPQTGKVVNVATWDDADPPRLMAHPPEPTDVMIELGPMH